MKLVDVYEDEKKMVLFLNGFIDKLNNAAGRQHTIKHISTAGDWGPGREEYIIKNGNKVVFCCDDDLHLMPNGYENITAYYIDPEIMKGFHDYVKSFEKRNNTKIQVDYFSRRTAKQCELGLIDRFMGFLGC